MLETSVKRIGLDGLDLIKHFEGLEPKAYQNVVGVWTIGYGHTGGAALQGNIITEDVAEELLLQDVETSEDAVRRRVRVDLNQNQFDALISWTFNLGEGNLRVSTLLKRLNAGEHPAVPTEMARWVYADGQVYDGLVRRRRAEGRLWNGVVDYT